MQQAKGMRQGNFLASLHRLSASLCRLNFARFCSLPSILPPPQSHRASPQPSQFVSSLSLVLSPKKLAGVNDNSGGYNVGRLRSGGEKGCEKRTGANRPFCPCRGLGESVPSPSAATSLSSPFSPSSPFPSLPSPHKTKPRNLPAKNFCPSLAPKTSPP